MHTAQAQRVPVSVIVSTANRPAHHVQRLLDRLREQSYRPLEVVLVVGPCPEDMRAFAESQNDVKVRFINELNLARSRNIGIGLASGEILAFIDDDAVPSYLWLHELIETFEHEGTDCAGVGGATVYANAVPSPLLQNRNAIISELGDSRACVRLEPGDRNAVEGPWFNRLHGCNMAFRRGAIEAVNGFDETFIYQHEETDLCIRLIRAGYRIVHHPRALVDHYPATSHFRRDSYDISYYNILRSYTYFALKHARRPFGEVATRVFRDHMPYWKRFAAWTLAFQISPLRALQFVGQWVRGYLQGLRMGWAWRHGRLSQRQLNAAPTTDFRGIRSAATWEVPCRIEQRKLRIALLCSELGGDSPGGVATYTEHLAEGLVRRGHDIVVFRLGYGPGNARPVGYDVVGVPAEPDRPFSVSVLHRLRSIAPFDIIEAPLWNGEGAAVGVAGLTPLVVRLETPIEVIRQISHLALSPAMISAISAERLELSYAAGVIAISRAIAGTVEEIYEARLENMSRLADVIPIGLPGAETTPLETIDPPDRDGVRILYVGRLEARKGILELGQAFAQAAREFPELKLWIAGADNSESDGHRARTGKTYPQTLLEMWGPELSRKVRFLGRVSEGQKNALIGHCDIFAAPSLYESFGIVFLEAMRLGKPVIGTRVGGIPEIVLEGETGLLVPPLDPGALAEAMLTLARNPQVRTQLGVAGFDRFLSHFTLDEFARRSELFYHQVIDHWHGCRFDASAAARKESRAA